MAHIPDGVLSIPVLLGGAAITAAGVAMGLRRLEPERIPQAAVLSAVFFVASLVHLPAGPSSVHLLLSGLVGIVLGWAAFPAILVALLLQAVLFGFGGVLVLGVNVATMAVPAVLAGMAFRRLWKPDRPRRAAVVAGVLAAAAVLGTAALVALALAASGREFATASRLVVLTALPVAAVEAAFTAAAVGLVARVKPAMLAGAAACLLMLAAAPAEAHRLKLFATAEGAVVVGEAYFAGGGPAVHVPGRMLAPDGSLAGDFTTDADGRFRIGVHVRQDHTLTVDGGDGHVASYVLPGSELPDTLPAGHAGTAAPPGAIATAPAAAPPELAALVESAVARQVRPLREQLDAYEAHVRLHDVLGGIGTIFGIFGLAAWLASRRKP